MYDAHVVTVLKEGKACGLSRRAGCTNIGEASHAVVGNVIDSALRVGFACRLLPVGCICLVDTTGTIGCIETFCSL